MVCLGFSHHASVKPIYKGALVKYKDIHASFSEASNAKLYTRNRSMPKYTCREVFEERGMITIINIYIYSLGIIYNCIEYSLIWFV